MKAVIFGLTISSAWGNGHATLWRALHQLGHDIVFVERDVPYYASHRDRHGAPRCRLGLYGDWTRIGRGAREHVPGTHTAAARARVGAPPSAELVWSRMMWGIVPAGGQGSAQGGTALGMAAGESDGDGRTVRGYREAVMLLTEESVSLPHGARA